MLGLYVHVPFCTAICNYCNFNRGLFDASLKERYVDALVGEIGTYSGESGSADTVYFGGGTPSLLDPDDVRRVIRACSEAFDLTRELEVTLEVNPESVSQARLERFRSVGVNRLSIGVQSLRDEELLKLSRLHRADRARAAYAEARAAGFDNVSLDLMMWLPGQAVSEWLGTVDHVIALQPDHVSLYMLEVYPNAPLREEMMRQQWSQAPDEDVALMYTAAMERLEAANFVQYEISNVAQPGRRSRHNLKYWTDGEWLGFGCGAHSTRAGGRWKNVSGIEDYVERVTAGGSVKVDVRQPSPSERLGDALFTGLRLSEGINEIVIEAQYGVDVWARYEADLDPFVREGLLSRENRRLRLTRRGMLLAHEIMAVFV
jgi:oxygen-independent coproporphyrinogen-3 oxidase